MKCYDLNIIFLIKLLCGFWRLKWYSTCFTEESWLYRLDKEVKGTLSGNGWMFVCVIRESKVFRASALLNEVWSPQRWLTETDCRETLPVNRVIWLPVNGAAPDFHMMDERWMRMGRCVVIALCGRTAILLWQSQTVCFQDFNPHVCSDVSRRNFTWSCYMIMLI